MARRSFIFTFFVLLLRAPLSFANLEFTIDINQVPGEVALVADFSFFPATEERLQEVVAAYSNMDLQNKINAALGSYISGPEGWISTHYTREVRQGGTVEYLTHVGIKVLGAWFFDKKTGLSCVESIESQEWFQKCEFMAQYEDTSEFAESMTQDNFCKIEKDRVLCQFKTTARPKRFNLGKAGEMLGGSSYSATQMGFKGMVGSLNQMISTQYYLEETRENRNKVRNFVSKYWNDQEPNSRRSWIQDFSALMPKKADPTTKEKRPKFTYTRPAI